MCSRRVFANNNNINYIDYYSSLNGQSMYKNLKSKGSNVNDINYKVINNQITNFLDYQTFLNITKAYFRQYGIVEKSYSAPYSINDSKTSFLCYNQLLSHIKDCDFCCKCKNITKICDCKDVKNILYPYGNYIEQTYTQNDYSIKDFNFPVKLQINNNNECNNLQCNGTCKKLVPICSEASYGCSNESSCGTHIKKREYTDKCAKKCSGNKCCNPCEKGNCCGTCKKDCCSKPVNSCLNNVYPSQHQFMYYKTNCGPCVSNVDYDVAKRISAYSIYPQINSNSLVNHIQSSTNFKDTSNYYTNIKSNYNESIKYSEEKKIGLGIYPQIPHYSSYSNPTCGNVCNPIYNPCEKNCNPCNPCAIQCDLCSNAKPLFIKK
jgi:hypothetical protein